MNALGEPLPLSKLLRTELSISWKSVKTKRGVKSTSCYLIGPAFAVLNTCKIESSGEQFALNGNGDLRTTQKDLGEQKPNWKQRGREVPFRTQGIPTCHQNVLYCQTWVTVMGTVGTGIQYFPLLPIPPAGPLYPCDKTWGCCVSWSATVVL